MATVSEDLIQEGTATIENRNAEEIQKLGDRIISVEPDNWYGLFVRGCGYAFEHDFSNTILNWKDCVANLDDEAVLTQLCPQMADLAVECMMNLSAETRLDFTQVSELLNNLNDKLPESEEEVFVNSVLSKGLEYLGTGKALEPVMSYYAFKAMVVTGFRSYVELDILLGFMVKLIELNRIFRNSVEGKKLKTLENDMLFVDDICNAMRNAIDSTPAETMEKIEEYWLEHKHDPYLSHVLQAYQMSAAVATTGKITSTIAKKVMTAEIQNFIKSYLGPKI